jgi:hypothetical protein
MKRLLTRQVWCVAILLIAASVQLCGQKQKPSVGDNSDWWSITRVIDEGRRIKTQHRELDLSNHRILGVDLHEEALDRLQKKLGIVKTVGRGDAAVSREQACFRSAEGVPATYLIAEEGEVNSAFYLFSAARHWHGEEFCKPVPGVTNATSTESGVHLGMTPEELIGILGPPSSQSQNRLIYFLEKRKRSARSDAARCRAQYSKNEEGLVEECDFYDLSVRIEACFADSKLTYFAATVAETT